MGCFVKGETETNSLVENTPLQKWKQFLVESVANSNRNNSLATLAHVQQNMLATKSIKRSETLEIKLIGNDGHSLGHISYTYFDSFKH